ncbi:MAG: ABC transporter ATP-binding protein [Chloroflexota bacterium]|nr:ABC transporter ATP-binding protein [Chloroflexota bacterium]
MNIEINHLTKVYRGDVYALSDLSLVIPPGMFGLVGPNGAGKTTLMRILVGILHPTSGTVQVGPYNAASEQGRTAIKQFLGYLPQELGMYPDLSAYEFLDYVGLLKGLKDRRQRRLQVEHMLETVALSSVARRKIKTFSGGMKRRLGIAQALINDPQMLIVDEPTAGLDPEERIRFRNLLSDLGGNRTVLLSTHIIEDIAQTCLNIAVMKSGQVIFQGTVTEMLAATRGKVWLLTTQGSRPEGNFTVVSTLNMGANVQYRVVGDLTPRVGAIPTEPGLEDSYVWLMHAHQPQPTGTPVR